MELATLLEQAASAPPSSRIELRDPIAGHGASAIEGVRPWLKDTGLAAFAVRVIERAGVDGEAALASKVLRSARTSVPADVAGDVDWALQRLRVVLRPPKAESPKAAASPAAALRREPPRNSPAPRRRTR